MAAVLGQLYVGITSDVYLVTTLAVAGVGCGMTNLRTGLVSTVDDPTNANSPWHMLFSGAAVAPKFVAGDVVQIALQPSFVPVARPLTRNLFVVQSSMRVSNSSLNWYTVTPFSENSNLANAPANVLMAFIETALVKVIDSEEILNSTLGS